MYKILFNRTAKVIEGEEVGKYIMIKDDTDGATGGYYLYISENNFDGKTPVYDNWYESYEIVLDFFANNKVQWENE